MELRLLIPVQKADSESSIISCIHTATCEHLAMKIFLGLPGKSGAYIPGVHMCDKLFSQLEWMTWMNDILNYLKVFFYDWKTLNFPPDFVLFSNYSIPSKKCKTMTKERFPEFIITGKSWHLFSCSKTSNRRTESNW